jgi:polyisoprenoid-binding protein YceI
MRIRIALPALLLALAPLLPPQVARAEEKPVAPVPSAPANLEGGDPIPAGAATITFPWIGKQSLTATSDAFERMVAQVDFSAEDRGNLGSVTLDGKGGGTGSFSVKVTDLVTGSTKRDEHLRSGGWLDAEKCPDIRLEITSLTQVKPTVFKMEGSWTMHGVTKPVSAWANVRYLPEMMYLGKDVVRVKVAFDVSLKAHDMVNPAIGTPAVADAWRIEAVILGLMKKAS